MATGATRTRIMDVALDLFVTQGVAATPVTAIESAAGLSPGSGSFYRHFKDRAELLNAVVDRELARTVKPAVPGPATGGSSPDSPGSPDEPGEPRSPDSAAPVARMLQRDLEFLRSLRSLIAILRWERGRAPEVAERIQASMLDHGIELSMGDLPAPDTAADPVWDDPEAAAAVMTSAVIGYHLAVDYFGAPPAGVSEERYTRMLARLLTRERS